MDSTVIEPAAPSCLWQDYPNYGGLQTAPRPRSSNNPSRPASKLNRLIEQNRIRITAPTGDKTINIP